MNKLTIRGGNTMTVLMQTKISGMTQEQYDANQAAGFFDKIQTWDGFEGFHAGGPVDGGWMVTELWASEAAHKSWITGFVMPQMQAAGVDIDPTAMTTMYFPVTSTVVAPVAVAH